MQRKRNPTSVPRPPRPTARRASSSGSSSRAGSDASGFHTLALSSRSRTSAVRRFETSMGADVELPYTLFEFGFPPTRTRALTPSRQFVDPAGIAFMASPAGAQLRATEHQYNVLLRQFMTRSVRVASTDVLVLGCGSSREILPLLQRGVRSVTFVDLSQPALDKLSQNLDEAGLTASVDVEYVCMDAWLFLGLLEGQQFDIVLATKCIGLILGTDPRNRDVPTLLDMVDDVLRDDGSFFCDHQVAFSRPGDEGRPLADVCPPDLLDLATIAGRYSADVCFHLDGHVHSLIEVASIGMPSAEHGVQSWQIFHFRSSIRDSTPRRVHLSPYVPRAPRELPMPVFSPPDPVVEAMMPVNARGAKRVPTVNDVHAHDVGTTRVKFDGTPGILVLSESDGLFQSPAASFGLSLPVSVSPPLVLMAELVTTGPSTCVIAVVGLLAVGETPSDPLDYRALQSIVPVLDTLLTAGIFPSVREHVRCVRGNFVELRGDRGALVRLPVDGVQLSTCGRDGIFVKTAEMSTADLVPSEAPALLRDAYLAAGLQVDSLVVDIGHGDGVFEYARVPGTDTWRRERHRFDKTFSDKPGAVVQTVMASKFGEKCGIVGTVESALDRVTR
uniref:Mythl transferase n=1 Tax=Pseudopestalotiopsis camelliae-sinensis polymycovirus 1 TaxID=3367397 RepID=A0AB74UL84_9VIRU